MITVKPMLRPHSCEHCNGPNVVFQKIVKRDGFYSIRAWCNDCQGRATSKPWLSRALFTIEEEKDMPIADDYTVDSAVCSVDGCGSHAVQWHHFAPRALFGKEAGLWPQGWLCDQHHKEWHKKVTQ